MDGFTQLDIRKVFAALLILFALHAPLLSAQMASSSDDAAPTTRSSQSLAYAALRGKPVEDVRIMGNVQVPTAVILNVVRTRAGDKFDPDTVTEDYQRIYDLKKFADVQAKAEPTATGVIVTFIVTEQKQIKEIRYLGNVHVTTTAIQDTIDLRQGEAIDPFRINIARQEIESLYKQKNYPYAHVNIDKDLLSRTGTLTFDIVEGPNVRVRMVDFVGNHSFPADRLRDEVQTKYWIWIFRPGTYEPDAIDDDTAALRRFYYQHGFFDARVGAKITESPEQNAVKVTFLINEGIRYRVSRIVFDGNKRVSSATLRSELKLKEGAYFDQDAVDRDIRQLVRDYSPLGVIYFPRGNSPDYLNIESQRILLNQPGTVELRYHISEGKSFRMGRVIVKGNGKTQDKIVLREMRVTPGQKYDSAAIADAADRLRGTPYFKNVDIIPVGDDPQVRDVVVDVTEAPTASFGVNAGVNSNGGVGGGITYEQRNFDITDWPDSWTDVFSDRAFIGAGQDFRISLQPGTQITNASVQFTEPWLFDQPYSGTGEVYYRDYLREHWDETRAGGRISLGKRFDYVNSALLTFRGEDVDIHRIDDEHEGIRAAEILALKGHSTLTSIGLLLRHDTTNHGPIAFQGSNTTLGWESYGLMGGKFTFQKLTAGWDWYMPLNTDLLDRKTVFALHADGGWIWGDAPFFERFYAGGFGTIRGFRYRGVSPRSGLDDDPVGGNFSATGSAELSFPLYGDNLRGVVFTDVGDVEPKFEFGTIRSSVGVGVRLTLPFLGPAPIALDFALPLTKSRQDDTEWISFSLGVTR